MGVQGEVEVCIVLKSICQHFHQVTQVRNFREAKEYAWSRKSSLRGDVEILNLIWA